MQRDIWRVVSFLEFEQAYWHCPHCLIGLLLLKKGNLLAMESTSSVDLREPDWQNWNPDSEFEMFSCLFTCNNPNCQEHVACCGNYEVAALEGADGEVVFMKKLFPTYVFPAPFIITIPPKCPDTVKKTLRAAFGLFWCDQSACANKIRQALEALMDEEQSPISSASKNLHRRIEEFSKTHHAGGVGEMLMAAKWIGNIGSHDGNLQREDLLDGFAMVEFVLIRLYDASETDVRDAAKEINSKRGVRSS